MKKTVTIAVIISITMTMGVVAQGVTLEYKFEKGKTYRYRDILDAKSAQEMMGKEITSEIHGRNIVRVIGNGMNPDGSMTLIAVTDSAIVKVKAGGVDTTQIPWNIIGKKFRMDVAKTGKVSNFTAADTAEDDAGQMVQNQLGHYPILSANPVSDGSTWNAESVDTVMQKQFGGTIITSTQEVYTLTGKETKNGHGCYKITSAGNFTITGKGVAMGMDLLIDGSGKSKANIFFDPVRGIIVASEADVDIHMTVATTGQSPMVIPTSESMKVIRTLLQ